MYTLPFKSFLKEPEQNGTFEVIQQGNNPIVGFANGNPCEDYKDTVIFGDHTLSLYKPERPFFVATDGVRLIKGKDINGYYLLSLLEKYKPQNEGYKRYYKILSEQMCYISKNYAEQQKIGSLFQHVDYLIALQEQKITLLNKYKKGLYKFIFSNIKAEKKIILKGIIKSFKKTSHKSGEGNYNGKYIFFTNNTSESNKYFDSYDYDDEVIIANTGGVANFKYYEGKFAAMSDCYIFKTSENTRYIYYWLDYMKNKINRLGFRGNGIKHLDKNWFLNLNLKLPSVSDQEKIVNILSTYDNLIDKEKQVLNRLQEMKSGLLQQMFI